MLGLIISFLLGLYIQQNYIQDRLPKIKKIYDAIYEYTPSRLKSLQKTIQALIRIEKENRLPETRKKGFYHELHYKHQGKKYILLVKGNVSPSYIGAENDKGLNITGLLSEFAGPLHNFHGTPITPKDIGEEKITILNNVLEEKVYLAGDIIRL